MTTMLYAATASADGYIAGPNGDMSWLKPFLGGEPDPIFEQVIPRISALLIGRGTYDGDDPNAGDPEKEGAFEGTWTGPQILLTHRPLNPAPPEVVVTRSFDDALQASRDAAGADGMVNVLGAETARQCLEAEVLDEMIISTVPLLLGSGTPILKDAAGSFTLEVINFACTTTADTRHYRVVY